MSRSTVDRRSDGPDPSRLTWLRRVVWIAILSLAGCTYRTALSPVDGEEIGAASGRQPGRYAAMVQSDAWNMKVNLAGLACAPHSFEADIDPAWSETMRTALAAALGQVDFVPTIRPPASLAEAYDAQIGVVQAGAATRVEITPRALGLQGFTAHADTKLEGALTIVFPDGTFDYEPLEGNGSGNSNGFFCGDVGPAIREASTAALQDIVRGAVATAKRRLAR